MATQVQFRRGSTAQNNTFTGASGELSIDTTIKTLRIHDGATQGGFELAKSDLSNTNNLILSGLTTISTLNVSNNVYVSGVSTFAGAVTFGNFNAGIITATTFSGALQGNASTATALQNTRTFEITGDIIASPVSFNGTGNVSLAATIQPNSVALGSDTTGDYVQSISGTSNQITVTGGTGESSTPTLSIPSQFTAPQDITVTRDLQVNRNLNVNGNITIGGTSATLFTTEFKVYDPDIVLGFRTDGSGNDASTDNTANHGGIAIASTEGSPLISLYDVGIGETNPATYKKFMWFKSGTFTGLGTDAWISNYAIGIGSTQIPNGVRLAAGGIQVTDSTLSVPQLNVSGVSTFAGITTVTGPTLFTGQLSVSIAATVYGTLTATDINSTSDINLKENIRSLDNSLEKVVQLNGVKFDWKETKQTSIGIIAQELEKVFPELVKTQENKSVNYNGLIGVLVEAIKEQQNQIEDLRRQIQNK